MDLEIIRLTEKNNPNIWADKGETYDTEVFDRYSPMILSFAEMVRGEKKNPWNYGYELMLYKTILKSCGMS